MKHKQIKERENVSNKKCAIICKQKTNYLNNLIYLAFSSYQLCSLTDTSFTDTLGFVCLTNWVIDMPFSILSNL